MRAAALLHRLPLPAADAGPSANAAPKRKRPTRRHRRSRAGSEAKLQAVAVSVTAPTPSPMQDLVARARSAGGPIDNASYACACGFVFAASVSTTVACPHCGADQAW
ncbi:MAG TPA: hypothetical protein VMG80_02750 [Solirubrobacteraceae bacterium]|nr:hypothetical protein [Solirubrobacteraceae bacterium]